MNRQRILEEIAAADAKRAALAEQLRQAPDLDDLDDDSGGELIAVLIEISLH
jgi:hypothetical protein